MAFEYLLIALVWNKVDIKVGQSKNKLSNVLPA